MNPGGCSAEQRACLCERRDQNLAGGWGRWRIGWLRKCKRNNKNQCYCGKADARMLWKEILIFYFLQWMIAEAGEELVRPVAGWMVCTWAPAFWVQVWISLFRSFLELFCGCKDSPECIHTVTFLGACWCVQSPTARYEQIRVPPGALLFSDLKYFWMKKVFWKQRWLHFFFILSKKRMICMKASTFCLTTSSHRFGCLSRSPTIMKALQGDATGIFSLFTSTSLSPEVAIQLYSLC